MGDWTGDGIDEWMVYRDPALDEGAEAIWVFSADTAVSGAFSTNDARGSWVLPTDVSDWHWPYALDMDGDGVDELVFSEDDSLYVIRGGAPLSIAADFPQHLNYTSKVCGSWPCSGDFDGDGFEDLLARGSDRDTDESWAWIIPGFDVPWEDGSRW